MSLNIEVDISKDKSIQTHKSKKILDLSLRQVGKRWAKNMVSVLQEGSEVFGNSRQPTFSTGLRDAHRIVSKKHRLFYIGLTCIFLALGVFYANISSS